MRSELRVIAEASKPRAVFAVIIPVVVPLLMIWGLATSGHSLADYPGLLATGELSIIRQGGGWIGLSLVVAIYVPPALVALRAPQYIATDGVFLVGPSGEKFRLADLESLSVRKTFWHKIMVVRAGGVDREVIITFAKQLADGIRRTLKANPDLAGVPIS